MREVVNAISYVLRGGIVWRMMPKHFPLWGTAYRWFARFRDEGTWEVANHHPSRDSLLVQLMGHLPVVEGFGGFVDGMVEGIGIGEGLVGEVVCLEVAPDAFDVVQLGSILGQPFDVEPMGAPASAAKDSLLV